MPRFVILEHDHPFLHWDFMLESAGVLRTWRLLEELRTGRTIEAEPLPDHRIAYLDYEGPVSGDRGQVRRWDHGEFSMLAESSERIDVRLSGRKLKGVTTVTSTQSGSQATFYFVAD